MNFENMIQRYEQNYDDVDQDMKQSGSHQPVYDWMDEDPFEDSQEISLRTVQIGLAQDHHKPFEVDYFNHSKMTNDSLGHQQIPVKQLQKSNSADYFDQDIEWDELIQLDQVAVPQVMSNLLPKNSIKDKKWESLFKFQNFNPVQSSCFHDIYSKDENIIISSPTGSGKTVLMELGMIRVFRKNSSSNIKVVYIAPTKALCEERVRDWQKFEKFGYSCSLLTGDTPLANQGDVQKSNIIVTTPEKWDSMTRTWRDSKSLLKLVVLLLVDEIHTLKDGSRGATLEIVITRMKSMKRLCVDDSFPDLRVIAVSATVPNLDDFGQWLSNSNGTNAIVRSFGEEFRPVQLQRHVFGYPEVTNQFAFEDNLKYKLFDIIKTYSNSKPLLIFCSTRKSTLSAAEFLCQESIQRKDTFIQSASKQALLLAKEKISDKKLQDCIVHGVAFHNAGMAFEDRRVIEELFLSQHLLIVCTTSTLAVGVNLPAHLVIIKGTNQYDFQTGKLKEYSDHDVNQMMGRAGRPCFDKTGVAVIMTSQSRKHHFENLLSGKELIESCLHESLIEHLNAEVVLGTTSNLDSAMMWLSNTFLYQRIKMNPGYYRLKNCTQQEAKLSAETRLETIFVKNIDSLKDAGLVQNLPETADAFSSTEYGQIMAKYYMRFATVKSFLAVSKDASIEEMLDALSKCEEFTENRFNSDKTALNMINKNSNIKYPIKGKVQQLYQKISICIQAMIGGVSLSDIKLKGQTLQQDGNSIMSHASRIVRGMVAIFIERNNYHSLCSSIFLARAIQTRLWPTSSTKLRQLDGIGIQYAKQLSFAGIVTFEDVLASTPQKIEMLTNRNPPFGTKAIQSCQSIPFIELHIEQTTSEKAVNPKYVEFKIELHTKNLKECKPRFKGQPITFYMICTALHTDLVQVQKFSVLKLKATETSYFKVSAPLHKQKIEVHLICNEIVGLDQFVETFAKFSTTTSPFFAKTADEDYWDDDIDDVQLLQVQEPYLKPKELSQGAQLIYASFAQEGNVPCNHTCHDKQACQHLCCKTGVSTKNAKKRKREKLIPATLSNPKKATFVQLQDNPITKEPKQTQIVPLSPSEVENEMPRDKMNKSIVCIESYSDDDFEVLPSENIAVPTFSFSQVDELDLEATQGIEQIFKGVFD